MTIKYCNLKFAFATKIHVGAPGSRRWGGARVSLPGLWCHCCAARVANASDQTYPNQSCSKQNQTTN